MEEHWKRKEEFFHGWQLGTLGNMLRNGGGARDIKGAKKHPKKVFLMHEDKQV
jgi:hypothetical protein